MREVAFLRVSCKVLKEFKSLFERVKGCWREASRINELIISLSLSLSCHSL